MDYKEKYNKLVEAVKVLQEENPSDEGIQNWVNDNVPELRESEDEKTRKEIVGYLKKNLRYEWATWLEKQGQKLNDKPVPKFKVGDWVVLYPSEIEVNRKVVQISRIEKRQLNMYWTTEGTWFGDGTEARLWTIQDAKDGDVLQLGEVTAIFKEFIGNGNCKCYCSVCDGEFEIPSQDGDDNSYGCHNAIPVTKEQRDTLFTRMRESGYKWDAEKKELKKIEDEPENYNQQLMSEMADLIKDYIKQKPTECIKFNNEFENQVSNLIVSVLNGEHEYNESFVKYVAQSLLGYAKNELKPIEWSEEDERVLNSAIWHLRNSVNNGDRTYSAGQIEEWLKSLKQRIGGKV